MPSLSRHLCRLGRDPSTSLRVTRLGIWPCHEIHLRHRRRDQFAGQRADRRVAWHVAGKPRTEGDAREVRPVPERRSRHDESVSARRSVRARRRRGDRPRPRPLRAIHERQAVAAEQSHQRPGLSERPREGARRRLPRQDGAGHSARHQRNQGAHPRGRREERRDVVITEIGGTIGDIEGLPFLEAIRQFALEVGAGNSLFIHVTLVPFIASPARSRPSRRSRASPSCARSASAAHPRFAAARSRSSKEVREKISMFCNVPAESA